MWIWRMKNRRHFRRLRFWGLVVFTKKRPQVLSLYLPTAAFLFTVSRTKVGPWGDFGLVWLVEFRWKLIRYRWILKWYGTLLIFIVIDIAWFWLKGFKSTLPCVVFGGPIQQRNRRFFWALEILRIFFNWKTWVFFGNPTAQRLKIHPKKPPFPLDHWVSSEFRD